MEDREKPHEVLLEGPRPDAPRVLEEILTWRWAGEAPSTAREYYAKWERLSHLECEWLPEERVRQLSEAKLRNFLRKREISAPGAVSAAERAEVAGGEAVDEVVRPAWTQPERVLLWRAADGASDGGNLQGAGAAAAPGLP